ncbi:MAG TPA: aspartate aminotransferase family protein [Candidatus Tumulicola sp.]|jgi:4-aminobutyrate aminotransferase-like enzyme
MSGERSANGTPIPGPRSRALLDRLRVRESRNVTAISHDFPVVWQSASGAFIDDCDGNRYLDLTSAFGVANVGHANPRVARAISEQAALLPHAMGDVHPPEVRIRLLERLHDILPGDMSRTFLATTGSEAVEAACKSAVLATGRTRFAAYRGAYHGLSLGALAVCGLEKFRAPFAGAFAAGTVWLDYPGHDIDAAAAIAATEEQLREWHDVAAVVIEPVQGRGGCIVPPDGYLSALRSLCDRRGILLIVDEIYTGFGRTGTWFAIERDAIAPDVLCIGKAMGGGFPISAAVGSKTVMDAWPVSSGEALHTSTYLGNPMGCAAALAVIDEVQDRSLPERAMRLGETIAERSRRWTGLSGVVDVRGRGAFWGIEFDRPERAERLVKDALQDGLILLQSGATGNVVTIGPPLVIAFDDLSHALETIERRLMEND